MKVLIISALIFAARLEANAQVVKLYCFEQPVTGGAFQKPEHQANDKDLPATNTYNSRFFLFAEIKHKSPLIFSRICINGRTYTFTIDTLKTLPFVVNAFFNGKIIKSDTLLKQSSGNFIQFTNLVTEKKSPEKKTNNYKCTKGITVTYKHKGIFCISKLANSKLITPLIAQ